MSGEEEISSNPAWIIVTVVLVIVIGGMIALVAKEAKAQGGLMALFSEPAKKRLSAKQKKRELKATMKEQNKGFVN